MTVETSTNRKRVSGDGVTDEISFTFKVVTASDLKVYKIPDSTGLKTELTTGFTTTLNSDSEGGTVTFDDPLESDNDYLILNEIPLTQTASLPTEGNFPEEAVENALDRLCLANIRQHEQITRAIKMREEDELAEDGITLAPDTAANRAGKALIFNSDGDGLETGPTADDISAAQGYATTASAAATAASADADRAEAAANSIDFTLGSAILASQIFG